MNFFISRRNSYILGISIVCVVLLVMVPYVYTLFQNRTRYEYTIDVSVNVAGPYRLLLPMPVPSGGTERANPLDRQIISNMAIRNNTRIECSYNNTGFGRMLAVNCSDGFQMKSGFQDRWGNYNFSGNSGVRTRSPDTFYWVWCDSENPDQRLTIYINYSCISDTQQKKGKLVGVVYASGWTLFDGSER